ncbi:MAG TPA: nuclear transport factor 2 family protein [Acidimicrobiia bacterium]
MTVNPPVDDRQLEHALLALDCDAWRALSSDRAADFFADVLTPHAIMVFPGTVLTKERALKEIDAAPPWAAFRIEDPHVVRFTERSAVITYRATAHREGQPEYVALMSSTYVENARAWKLALHQQTPIDTT